MRRYTVADCVVVKDFAAVMGARTRRSKLLEKLKGLKFDAAYFQKVGKLGALTTQRKRCDDVRSEVRRCDAEIAEKFSQGFDSVCAFVTFEDAAHRADCINAHKVGRCRLTPS